VSPPATPSPARRLRWALDPSLWARDALGWDPDPWQVQALTSSAKYSIWNICRQAGKSTTAAVLALHTAVHKPGSLVLLVSPSLRQSGELHRKVTAFRRRLDPAPQLDQDNSLATEFTNRSRVVSLPGGETVRGYSAPSLLLVDEAARVDDELLAAVRPMLAVSEGRMLLMSTPSGQAGAFYQTWHDGGDDWERVMVTAEQCPRISAEFLESEKKALGQRWLDQEFFGRFLADRTQIFDAADIARALCSDLEPLDLPEPGQVAPLHL
jgi:hypothetical protein